MLFILRFLLLIAEGDWIEQDGIKYRHGEGTFTHPSGEKYEGGWEWDVMTGNGKFDSVTGSCYKVRTTYVCTHTG